MTLNLDALEEQSQLPPSHSVEYVARGRDCPVCDRDVSDSLGSHVVDADVIADEYVSEGDVPVFGFACEYCELALPVDARETGLSTSDIGPASGSNGWLVAQSELDGGSGAVYVPTEVILG